MWLCACKSMHACLHVPIHHFLQNCVTIFQLTCRSEAWSLVLAFQNDKVYLSVFWYAQRKLGLTAGGGRKRSHNKHPPHSTPHDTQHKMSSFAWLWRTPSHPAEKSRHLKLCDMCHRHCHWASVTDGAGIDRPRATGAGWGTHRVWCVSLPILIRDASWAATPTQTALWDGWGVVEWVDMRLCACEGMKAMPSITDSRLIKVWTTDLPVDDAHLDPQLLHCRCSFGSS